VASSVTAGMCAVTVSLPLCRAATLRASCSLDSSSVLSSVNGTHCISLKTSPKLTDTGVPTHLEVFQSAFCMLGHNLF
jgi:hypothetical protein